MFISRIETHLVDIAYIYLRIEQSAAFSAHTFEIHAMSSNDGRQQRNANLWAHICGEKTQPSN